jgi:hypothetical protein
MFFGLGCLLFFAQNNPFLFLEKESEIIEVRKKKNNHPLMHGNIKKFFPF